MARLLVRDVYLEEIPQEQEPLMRAWLKSREALVQEDPSRNLYRWDGVLAGLSVAVKGGGGFGEALAQRLNQLLDLAGASPKEGQLPSVGVELLEGSSPGKVDGAYIGLPFARAWLVVYRALRHVEAPLSRGELRWDLRGTFRLFRPQTSVRFRVEVPREGEERLWLAALYGLLLAGFGRAHRREALAAFVEKALRLQAEALEPPLPVSMPRTPSVHVFQRPAGEREIPPLMRAPMPKPRTTWHPPA